MYHNHVLQSISWHPDLPDSGSMLPRGEGL
jgi:hypothetical protein